MDNTTATTIAFFNTTLAFDTNDTESNVTTSRPLPRTPPPVGYYGDIRIQLWKILPPIIMTWGIAGNILSVVILLRIARRTSITSTTLYLVTLAMSDTVILLCGPLRNWIKFIWEKDVRYSSDAACKSQLYFTYLSIHFSSWILVAITMERVASVVFPHKVKLGCTPRNATITILITLVVLGGLSLVHPIIQSLKSARQNIQCAPSTPEYVKFRDDVYVWIDFFLSFGVPFVFLLVGNAVIIFRLNKSRLRQKKMNVSRGDGNKSGRDMRSLSIMLMSLSAVFLLTMTPVNIFSLYYPYKFEAILKLKNPYQQWSEYQYLLYQHAIVNMVGYTNACFNFIMYVLTGTKFRKEFFDMFRCAALSRKLTGATTTSSGTKQSSVPASDSAGKHSMSTITSNQTTTTNAGNGTQTVPPVTHNKATGVSEDNYYNTNQTIEDKTGNTKQSTEDDDTINSKPSVVDNGYTNPVIEDVNGCTQQTMEDNIANTNPDVNDENKGYTNHTMEDDNGYTDKTIENDNTNIIQAIGDDSECTNRTNGVDNANANKTNRDDNANTNQDIAVNNTDTQQGGDDKDTDTNTNIATVGESHTKETTEM